MLNEPKAKVDRNQIVKAYMHCVCGNIFGCDEEKSLKLLQIRPDSVEKNNNNQHKQKSFVFYAFQCDSDF